MSRRKLPETIEREEWERAENARLTRLAEDTEGWGNWLPLVRQYLPKTHERLEGERGCDWVAEKHASGQAFAITAQKAAVFLEFVEKGNFLSLALRVSDISPSLLQKWLQKGGSIRFSGNVDRETESVEPYRTFSMMFDVAEGVPEATALAGIIESGEWKAQSWFLERRYRQRWGPDTSKVGVAVGSGTAGVVIMIPDNGRDPIDTDDENAPELTTGRTVDERRYVEGLDYE